MYFELTLIYLMQIEAMEFKKKKKKNGNRMQKIELYLVVHEKLLNFESTNLFLQSHLKKKNFEYKK